ncbi:hypothetical protein B0O80DRAFT_500224 [Mortierella sp. GBAus27b]|nr:hypothetical protein BGX31_001350 [Mortierella sp. GBA43]KAI8351370.1 hypothetical protein B0O80DRAFT_500224 [Mortierella sp. GBAus27b]
MAMNNLGKVEEGRIVTRPCTKRFKITAMVVFENADTMKKIKDSSRKIVFVGMQLARLGKFGTEVVVDWNMEHVAKLSGLPRYTTEMDLVSLLGEGKIIEGQPKYLIPWNQFRRRFKGPKVAQHPSGLLQRHDYMVTKYTRYLRNNFQPVLLFGADQELADNVVSEVEGATKDQEDVITEALNILAEEMRDVTITREDEPPELTSIRSRTSETNGRMTSVMPENVISPLWLTFATPNIVGAVDDAGSDDPTMLESMSMGDRSEWYEV